LSLDAVPSFPVSASRLKVFPSCYKRAACSFFTPCELPFLFVVLLFAAQDISFAGRCFLFAWERPARPELPVSVASPSTVRLRSRSSISHRSISTDVGGLHFSLVLKHFNFGCSFSFSFDFVCPEYVQGEASVVLKLPDQKA
jgi:hypothetical protein